MMAFAQVAKAELKPFRFHLFSEPISLDPQLQRNSSSSYLLGNLYRNFYWYDDDKGLVSDLGEKCLRPKKNLIRCQLKKNLKWSDGSALTSDDFIQSYRRLLSPELKAPRADLLFDIKNAKEIYLGHKKMDELGVKAISPLIFEISLEQPSPDFEYNLANTILSPVKNKDFKLIDPTQADKLVVSGPYQVKKWEKGFKINLTSNKNYSEGFNDRPDVELSFIEDDSVALRLYEKNELDFDRRLPTLYFSKWKKSSEFYWLPVIRFDYIGFGPALKDQVNLRKALSLSLNYKELQTFLDSEGRPGCAGIPESWINKLPCHDYNIQKAKLDLPKPLKNQKLEFVFSNQGGDDHKRVTDWIQSQWSQNINVQVETRAAENKIFTARLKESPPTIFRRGISPDRATCLSVLETFSKNHPDNFIQMKDDRYFKILENLSQARDLKKQKKFCQDGIEFLISNYYLIPTGAIHFAVLSKPNFTGWKLNGMNQLDLSGLKRTTLK